MNWIDKMLICRLEKISKKLEEANNLEDAKLKLGEELDVFEYSYKESDTDKKYEFIKEKGMDIFTMGDEILLCKFRQEDYQDFVKLQKENAIMTNAFAIEGFETGLWEEVHQDTVFYTTIRKAIDDTFMGYCGIKNTQRDELELAIEVLKEFHGNGYGRQSLTLFMKKVKEMTGIDSFKALVDCENIASQKMCEACGGIPSGIEEYLLHDKEYMKKYELENANMITKSIEELAKKFNVRPEKLLTHVLVYRFKL